MRERFFLLIRDRVDGTVVLQQFEDRSRAYDRYIELEHIYAHFGDGDSSRMEIVMIGADSEADVRRMYAHYFLPGDRDTRQRGFIDGLSTDDEPLSRTG